MNDKNFDSFIKQGLDGHSSPVPIDMWKRVQAEKDFDPFVKDNLNKLHSAVPADMWQRIHDEKDFDTHIKEKLDNLTSQIPADMWQRIRPEEKKRRPIIWWWAAAASLILMAGIGASWYINRKPSSNNISKNKIAPSANSSQSGNNITVLSNQSASSISPIQGHDSLTIPNANHPVVKTNTHVGNDLHPSNYTNDPTNPLTSPIFSNKTKFDNQENNTSNPNSQAFLNNNNNGGNPTINNNIRSNIDKNLHGAKTNNNGNNLNPTSAIAKNGLDELLENRSLLNSSTSTFSEKQSQLKNLIRLSLGNNKLAIRQLLSVKKMPTIVCPTLGPPKRNDWYVEAFVSPDYMIKSVQDKSLASNTKKAMDSTLHRQVSFSAGVNIVKSLGKNFLIKTGVQYAQVNELFKYNSGSDTRTTTVITVRDVIVTPGDTIHIRDTSTVSQTGTLTKQNQNHYKQWDIPLIFGYEFGGNGFRMNADLGLIANIRSSYQGNMLDTAQKAIDIATYNNAGIYRTNIGLGVYLGLGFLKPLNDNMDLLIEPHARFNLSNMTTQATIFNQKNSIFGLSVGLRYKINGRGGQRY